jgi:hypothetical protein
MENMLPKEIMLLLNCEVCDEYIKRKYLDLKELYYKIFKAYTKFIKFIKTKEEGLIKKSFEELSLNQKEFINLFALLKKLVNYKLTNTVNVFIILVYYRQ